MQYGVETGTWSQVNDAFIAAAATPEWEAVPGNLDYSSIYNSGLQKGWNLDTWSSNLTVHYVNYTQQDISDVNNTAMCFAMPTPQVSQHVILSCIRLQPAMCRCECVGGCLPAWPPACICLFVCVCSCVRVCVSMCQCVHLD